MSDDIRDEVAKLAEAVHALRDREVADELASLRAEVEKLRAERDSHACHGHCSHSHCSWGHCNCFLVHTYMYPLTGTVTYPQTWTVTSTNVGATSYVATNVAAGCSPAITTFTVSN
jgi:hypothetical protein